MRPALALLAIALAAVPAAAQARRDPAAAAEAHRRGLEAARAGDARGAIEHLRRAVEADYGNVAYHLAYGQALEAENPAAALIQYQLAFKYAIGDAAESAPAVEFLRRLLVARCVDLALPIEDADRSADLLRLAISLSPDDARLHLHLAGAHFVAGDYRAALREAYAARALGLDDGPTHLNIAAAHLQLGETAAAEREVRAAIEADEFEYAQTLGTLGRTDADTRWVGFRQTFGDRIDRWIAESWKGWIDRAWERARRGDARRAIELAREAVDLDTRSAYVAVHLGDILALAGETTEAEAAYREADRRNPRNVMAAPRLGDLLHAAGRYGEAADVYVAYLERPDIGDARLGEVVQRAAESLRRSGDRPRALRLLDDWLARNPRGEGAFEARRERAEILDGIPGRSGEADRAFRALVEEYPLRPEAWRALHDRLTAKTRTAEARSVVREGIVKFDLAIEARPRDYALRRGRADLLALLGRRDEAVATLLEGARRSGAYEAAANDLAALHAETEALAVVRLWIDETDGRPEPLLYYAWIAAEAGIDLDTALRYVSDVEAAVGRTPPVIRTLARVMLARGEYRQAAALAEEVLAAGDLVPHAATFHRIAAEAYRALDDPIKAAEHERLAR